MAEPDKLTYGSYEVLQNPDGSPCLLGQGSFGATYKARHVLLGRVSALKVIREDLLNRGNKQDQEEIKRFLGEARAVGRLHHPGIAVVHDCALDKGVFYYAMEYCDGGTLQNWCLKNGPMPWSAVRQIASQIAAALSYAHGSGFLHRDIKPANIMLHGEGAARQAKLIDFGLAMAITTDTDTSSATVRNEQENFRGNFATASPEQILEKPLDPRSDLFSFGVTLWWLLLGKNPFGDLKHGPLIIDRTGPASYAPCLPRDLPAEARDLLAGLLEKDADKRIATALEVVERIEAAGAAVLTTPTAAVEAVASPAVALVPLPGPPDLEADYAIGGVLATATQAKLYTGENLATRQPVIMICPDAALDPDARGGMRVAASRKLDFGVYAFLDWRTSGGDDVFVISKPDGCSLMAILRKFGPAKFADALPLLSHLALCFDASQEWTTFGIQVEPGEIFVGTRAGSSDLAGFRSWSDLDPHTARCLPLFTSGADHSASNEATLSTSAQEFPPLAQFAALVYRVLSGSAVRYASFFTSSGYVMASGLSEDGNALLAATICTPESQPSACRFVRALAGLESLPVATIAPLLDAPSAQDLAIGKLDPTPSPGVAARGRVLGAATPLSATGKVSELERQLALAKRAAEKDDRKEAEKTQRLLEESQRKAADAAARQQAAASQAAAEQARRQQEEATRAAAAESARRQPAAPPRAAAAVAPPVPSAARSRRKVLAIVAVVGVLAVTLIASVMLSHGAKREAAAAKARADELARQTAEEEAAISASNDTAATRPDTTVEPDAAAKPNEPAKSIKEPPAGGATEAQATVKVPGEVKSIAEAVKRCTEGGTIEIAGGTYQEAILLTKSLTLVSTSAAVFDSRDLSSNLLVASGPIQVTLRGIQLKNTQEAAPSSPQSSPALVLIKNGAAIRFDGCVIEGALGNGVTLADKSSATFSHCPVLNNRGNGIHASGASKVEISLSEVRKNGRSGLVVEHVGSTVLLGGGTKVEENSKSGVEVGKGAVLRCRGASFNSNEKVGLIVDGSGSQASLEASCAVSNNRMYGVCVANGGQVTLSESTVEGNSKNGLAAESGAQAEIISCQFKSNGEVGVYLVNGSASMITISKTVFQAHSDAGIAVIEGIGKVTDCIFTGNKMAMIFGKGARGAATGNKIQPGPLEDTLVLEEAGEVSLGNNTIGGAAH